MRKLIIPAFIILFGSTSFAVQAQTPAASPAATTAAADSGIKANLALGEVSAINQTDNKISLKTKDGAIDVVLTATTVFKKVPPENPKLSAATDAALSDIGEGDKVLVTGNVAADKKTVPAKTIYIMTKADISKKISSEQQAWKTRGISGRVVSVNPATKEFTIASRGMMGEQNVVVKPKDYVDYRRYAPDSVKFDDAKSSSFSELKVGDQIRALGDKSADNTTFQAERIVSGSFKMVGGTITAIDTAKNEITIKELQTNKPVTIVVNNGSQLKKFPVEMATMMATRMQGGGIQPPQGGQGGAVMMRPPGSQPPAGQPQTAPGGTAAPQGMQGGGGGMRAARGEFDDLLERFPTISIADLKVGDAIAISSSSNADTSRYTAIKLVSGVEPFFKAPQIASGAPRGGGGQGGGGLNIPGLDGGIGTP
jgi:hypothetical protein